MLPTMLLTTIFALLSSSLASAQLLAAQGLPACAQTCTLLNNAAQACSGTASANQATWSCFCQSGYLTGLYSSPSGICDAFCTDPAQNQQVMTWYTGNCGTDNGASEHADDGSGGQTTTAAAAPTTTSAATPATTTRAATSASSSAGAQTANRTQAEEGSWWDNHWKWIVMVIVLAIALSIIAILATWFKKRHDRKRDLPNTSFNEGITTRTAPTDPALTEKTAASSRSVVPAAPAFNSSPSGRNSPARTRDAFMPYGYNYTRSEPRLASGSEDVIETVPPLPAGVRSHEDDRASPVARGSTPVGELEKGGIESTPTPTGQIKRKKVLVRERSAEDDLGTPGKGKP